MPGKDLLGALAEVVARRRKDSGEFSYIFLATGTEVAGKKSVYKMLKCEEAVFEAIKDDHQEENETDLAFDSRAMKVLPMVPFDDEKDTSAVVADAEAALSSSSSSKGVIRDWEALTKAALSKLVARRRLEGGEFTYIYIPLEKTVAGKKAVFKFLKSQTGEYKKLVQACKNPAETTEQFESRLLQQILVVPYEQDVIEDMEVDDNITSGGKRKIVKQSHDPKKAKLDSPTPGAKPDTSGKTVFIETEIFSSFEAPHHSIIQLGALEGPNKFFKPVQLKKNGEGYRRCSRKAEL